MPAELQIVLDDVEAQLACDDEERKQLATPSLSVASRSLTAMLLGRRPERGRRASFTRYLTEAVLLCNSAIVFSDAIHTARLRPIAYRAARSKATSSPRSAYRRAHALRAFVIILSGCLVWIYSAWPDGGTAVSILGVCCAVRQLRHPGTAPRENTSSAASGGVVISLLYALRYFHR